MNTETKNTEEVPTGPSLSMAALGGSEFTLGFELVGIKTIISTDSMDANARLDALMTAMQNHTIGILIVDEDALTGIGSYERAQMENAIRPVVVVLRSEPGDAGNLRRQIMRAIGVDLYAHDADNDKTS